MTSGARRGAMDEASREVPRRLAEYEIVRELGAGAMGRVFLARRDGTPVALKVLHDHLLAEKGFFRRFQREARAGITVCHENVVRVIDSELQFVGLRPYAFLVMEYVEGCTLRDLIAERGALPESMVRDVARQVSSGLAAIHAAGIVHRDVKPENVMIDRRARLRLMDLGVARVLDGSTRLTADGQFPGSLLYASPEQVRGCDPGPESDLYSLGVVLYELAAGVNPFRRAHPAAVLDAHLFDAVPDPLARVPGMSPFLAAVIASLLAKRPASRFRSAGTLHEVLVEGRRSQWWRRRSSSSRAR